MRKYQILPTSGAQAWDAPPSASRFCNFCKGCLHPLNLVKDLEMISTPLLTPCRSCTSHCPFLTKPSMAAPGELQFCCFYQRSFLPLGAARLRRKLSPPGSIPASIAQQRNGPQRQAVLFDEDLTFLFAWFPLTQGEPLSDKVFADNTCGEKGPGRMKRGPFHLTFISCTLTCTILPASSVATYG